ncbi:unnamed protein product [Caenorhabditis angaria]|uniref:EndoU domain-containing protein n=1 Tax=Caenorhabditis angaria TaxID=860376 RepID=A0A9P1J158_9PELO|nr:unnamed protein product [Caenorhabditis angaria]
MRIFVFFALAVAAVYTAPVFLDLTTVNTFLTSLASSDVRTDSKVTLNYQNMASKKSPDHDNAASPLFTTVDSSITSGSIYTAIANLLKFYSHDSETAINLSTDLQSAISDFLDKIIATPAVTQAKAFLYQQGVSPSDAAAFKTQLYNLWFLPYARSSVVGSCGFKSVFVGESTGTSITRFANWYGFYLQEQSGSINYHGWFTKLNVS